MFNLLDRGNCYTQEFKRKNFKKRKKLSNPTPSAKTLFFCSIYKKQRSCTEEKKIHNNQVVRKWRLIHTCLWNTYQGECVGGKKSRKGPCFRKSWISSSFLSPRNGNFYPPDNRWLCTLLVSSACIVYGDAITYVALQHGRTNFFRRAMCELASSCDQSVLLESPSLCIRLSVTRF